MNTQSIVCNNCGKEFEILTKEYNRQIRKQGNQRGFFCSRSCAASSKNKKWWANRDEHDFSNMFIPTRELDALSPFRAHMKMIRRRAAERNKEVTVTLEDLKELWEKQDGICAYTGWKLILPESSGAYDKAGHLPKKASVDRKDSSKGYTKDNIEFVAMIVNLAKNSWDRETVLTFCRAVTENQE